MRVGDIVIGGGPVIFWVGWFAASARAKRGQRGRGDWARFAGVRWCSSWSSCSWSGCGC